MSAVYHYTDTARLPWILSSGELRAGANRIAGYPDPDFLWATTSPIGDRSASALVENVRSGLTRSVRFTLYADDFIPWPEAVGNIPAWTPELICRLERAAAGRSSPRDWRCRSDSLPRDRWFAIETRTYTDKAWRPISETDQKVIDLDDGVSAVAIGTAVYSSERVVGPQGQDGFRVRLGQRAAA